MHAARLAVCLVASASLLSAQAVSEHVARGDQFRAALDGASALREYLSAVRAMPASVDALWRASSEAIDLGEFNEAGRDTLYRLGEALARRAVLADSTSSMAHFALAKALGRRAQSLGARDRVKYAEAVRAAALESLKRDSVNPGALHVMGMWNAEIMRLSGVERFFAKRLLGGRTMSEASWDSAVRYLARAVTVDPDRIVHRYELGSVWLDRGERLKAREVWQSALPLRPLEPNDPEYRRRLEARLAGLR
jgi:tetratricopeptide (TPR) repeat protein